MDLKWVDTSLNLSVSPSSSSRHNIVKEETQKGEHSGEYAISDHDGKVKVLAVVDEALVQELQRIASENKKLMEMLTVMSEKYSALHNHLKDLTDNHSEKESPQSRKRKGAENECNHGIDMFGVNGTTDQCNSSDEESCKRPTEDHRRKVKRVLVRADPSETSQNVKDGYHWRKYGQKVTRGNPSPRAYFKCSYAPNCPVKKKVQRSLGHPSFLVVTYEGEHNHAGPAQTELPVSSFHASDLKIPHSMSSINPAGPTVSLDLFQQAERFDARESMFDKELAPEFRQFLVQQMATSLTKDPHFTTALVTAISGRTLDET